MYGVQHLLKVRYELYGQTRGGLATFVSGRMEGELHDSEEDAIKWLREVGVEEERINPL